MILPCFEPNPALVFAVQKLSMAGNLLNLFLFWQMVNVQRVCGITARADELCQTNLFARFRTLLAPPTCYLASHVVGAASLGIL